MEGGAFATRLAVVGGTAKNTKGGLAASLFFVSLALACAGSRAGQVWPWAASALALIAAAWSGASRPAVTSWPALVVFGFAGWVVLHTLLVSPAYTPAGLYHPLLLALGFAAFRRFDDSSERLAALAALACGAALAAWGLVQVGVMGIARAHALFEAPATYAALVNLLLMPLLAMALVQRQRWVAIALAIALAAALFASESRGGLLALAAGLGAAAFLAYRASALQPQRLLVVLALLAAGWLLATGLRMVPAHGGAREALPGAELQAQSTLSRLELYGASWRAWQERPLAGTGYLTFRYVLERDRERVPSYGAASETWFAHNDYLQALQELGPLGLAGLLALAGLPLLIACRRMAALAEDRRAGAIAATAALSTMGCHALVDFPFYVPACLLLYGALLGALERRLSQPSPIVLAPRHVNAPWGRAARAGAAAIAAILFAKPLLAEASAEWGLRQYAHDQAQSAAFWLEAARRLEPADWRYHWYAGQFWDGTATASRSRDAARFADAAFAAGIEANPYDVHNLLGRIALHRRVAPLLAQPADRATLGSWLARAEALAPLNPVVRRERALHEGGK